MSKNQLKERQDAIQDTKPKNKNYNLLARTTQQPRTKADKKKQPEPKRQTEWESRSENQEDNHNPPKTRN